MKRYSGFTYIEVLVVLGMLAIASTLLVPLSFSQLGRSRVVSFASDASSYLFSVQQDAVNQVAGSPHGMRFNSDSYDIFQGLSYATAVDSTTVTMINDVQITNTNLTNIVSGLPTTEVVFDRGSFRPSAYGSVTFSNGLASYDIVINIEGLIYYEKN